MKAVKGKYYFGGIHPRDGKSIAKSAAIEVMPAPAVAAVSTYQSMGKPASPVVEAGKAVKLGEVIAKADGAVSSDVFAPVSGTVTEIKDIVSASGKTEKYIFIESDGKDE